MNPLSLPAFVVAMEFQLSELTDVLARLQSARTRLLPGPGDEWAGWASQVYDSGIAAMTQTVDAGIAAVKSARVQSQMALAVVSAGS